MLFYIYVHTYIHTHREAAELEAWISEKEAVASSEDTGRDLEHVEVRVGVRISCSLK